MTRATRRLQQARRASIEVAAANAVARPRETVAWSAKQMKWLVRARGTTSRTSEKRGADAGDAAAKRARTSGAAGPGAAQVAGGVRARIARAVARATARRAQRREMEKQRRVERQRQAAAERERRARTARLWLARKSEQRTRREAAERAAHDGEVFRREEALRAARADAAAATQAVQVAPRVARSTPGICAAARGRSKRGAAAVAAAAQRHVRARGGDEQSGESAREAVSLPASDEDEA